MVAPSNVSGWGLFSLESVKRGEFLSEYCGEVVSSEEADRRGTVYDELQCSYLYDLCSKFSVDATRMGSLARFMNHSDKPNCFPRVLKVNGEHRIGIFAKMDIKPNKELFINYGESHTKIIRFTTAPSDG